MKPEPLSPSVRKLIADQIDSVGQLELILFLHRHPDRAWTASELVVELRTSLSWLESQLPTLAHHTIAASESAAYRYAAGGDLHGAISELAAAYVSYPVAVVTLIYSKPRPTLRNFADAFRLRKSSGKPGSPDDGGPPRG